MAKTNWWALWDIQVAAGGYEGIAKTAFKKGGTLNSQEPTLKGEGASEAKGMHGTVFTAKLALIEAESGEEACIIAGEAYGNRGGNAAWPKAEKELEFKPA